MMEMGPSEQRFTISPIVDSERVAGIFTGLENLLEMYPALEAYSPGDLRNKAQNAFRNIPTFVKRYGDLLKNLHDAQRNRADVALLVIPGSSMPETIDHPLVFATLGEDTLAMSPVLSCTISAIEDIEKTIPPAKGYIIVHTTMSREQLLTMVSDSNTPILSYDKEKIKPADYIAHGTNGLFINEQYRIPLSELQSLS